MAHTWEKMHRAATLRLGPKVFETSSAASCSNKFAMGTSLGMSGIRLRVAPRSDDKSDDQFKQGTPSSSRSRHNCNDPSFATTTQVVSTKSTKNFRRMDRKIN